MSREYRRCPGGVCRHGHGDRCRAVATGHHRLCELTDPDGPDYVEAYVATLDTSADPPSLARRAVNFAGSLARHVAHGMPEVPPEEKARRLAVCRECPRFVPESEACGICGCNLPIKTGWALERCPAEPPRW